MSCFTTMTAAAADADLDLTKHVSYTAGMILGVDDFTQEFAYLSGRDRWLARDAVGYGTISGLALNLEKDGAKGFRIVVAPGVAISPRGQLICVSSAQCAYLNQWLAAADLKDLQKHVDSEELGSPPISSPPVGESISLYVVLCYRDCPTDSVPIPGEPCRSESELTAASRIKDDFSLELRFEPPKQLEENAVKKFVAWLKEIEITDTGASTDLNEFLKAIRAKWLSSSAGSNDITSPPITSPSIELQINSDDITAYMQAAMHLWVTELRNFLSGRKTGCSVEMTGGGKLDDCVLLGEIKISMTHVSPGWEVSDSEKPVIIEKNRPFLIHLRMLQELILSGGVFTSEASLPIVSPPFLSPPELPLHSHTLGGLSDVNLPSNLADGQMLIFKNGKWTAENSPGGGGVSDHGALTGLGDDDHQIYLLASGTRALSGNLNGGGNRITNLAAANANGQAVIFQQAIKQSDPAGGDLGAAYPNPSVIKIQGRDVLNQAPSPGDSLVWNGTAWRPLNVTGTPPPPAKPFLILPLATVTRREIVTPRDVTNVFYEVWFNIDAPGNLAEIKKIGPDNLTIFDETDGPVPFLDEIKFEARRLIRNVFLVQLSLDQRQTEPNFMRFNFNVKKTIISVGTRNAPLIEYAEENNINFASYLEGEFATVFVRGADEKI